jgi:hypothetical protein
VYNKFFRFGCIIICWETTDSESRVICFSYRMWVFDRDDWFWV